MTPCSQVCICGCLPLCADMRDLWACVKAGVCAIKPTPQSLQTHFPQQIKPDSVAHYQINSQM